MANSIGQPIESIGYAGQIMANVDWAQIQWALGVRYFVYDNDSVKVTPVAGGTREVAISGGRAGGWGILDTFGTGATSDIEGGGRLQLPVVASGFRWFLIALRRTWGIAQETSIVYIDAGTTTPTALPTRNINPGVLDDQPLAFVQLTAGSTVPTAVIDLRIIGGKDFFLANSELVMLYMAYDGIQIRIGTTVWTRRVNTNGTRSWDKQPGVSGRVALPAFTALFASEPGWTSTGLYNRVTQNGNLLEITMELRRTGASIVSSVAGGLVDMKICTIAAQFRPAHQISGIPLMYLGGPNEGDYGSYSGLGVLKANGDFMLSGLTEGARLNRQTIVRTSLACHFLFNIETAS